MLKPILTHVDLAKQLFLDMIGRPHEQTEGYLIVEGECVCCPQRLVALIVQLSATSENAKIEPLKGRPGRAGACA